MKAVDPNFMARTKKVRRVQIANVPLFLNLNKEEVKVLITQYLKDHYLNEPGNDNPIHSLELNH